MVKIGKILYLNDRLSVFITDGVIPRGAYLYFLSTKMVSPLLTVYIRSLTCTLISGILI